MAGQVRTIYSDAAKQNAVFPRTKISGVSDNNDIGLQALLDGKAPLASPNLSGIPTAPTAAAGTNTTQIATTAFVQNAVGNYATITLPTFSGAGSQAVSLTGVTSDSHPILDIIIPSGTSAANMKAMLNAWSHIYNAETSAGAITFYSDAATSIQLTIAVKGY